MNSLLKYQPLLETLAEVLNYSDLVRLSQIEKRFQPYLKIRQQKLNVVRIWAKRTSITFEELTNLQQLDLRQNQITEIPPEIGQLSNLQKLILDGNRITEIPLEIGQLSNLHWLDITGDPDYNGKKFTEIPPIITQLTNLQVLILDNNQITKITEIAL